MNCTKCGCEIFGGFFNYPSGIQCANCGGKKGVNDQFKDKLNLKAPQMLKLIIEMDKYLNPKHRGQINTINTGSIFHQQLKDIIKQLS